MPIEVRSKFVKEIAMLSLSFHFEKNKFFFKEKYRYN